MIVQLDLPEPPSANRWWRKWKNRVVLSTEARAYKANTYRWLLLHYGYRTVVFSGGTTVKVTIYWCRGIAAGDLDKRLGVALDALQGTVYESDKQIVELHAYRIEAPKQARLHVEVEAVDALADLPLGARA